MGAGAPRVSSEVPMEGRHPKWRGWPGALQEESLKRNGAGKTENSLTGF